jgi:Mce-associated membrane protein
VSLDVEESRSPVDSEPVETKRTPRWRRIRWKNLFAFAILPAAVVLLAAGTGYLKWLDHSAVQSQRAEEQSVRAASDTTVAMLAYQPDTVDTDLRAAADRLTGGFRDEYLKLVNDIVIPGSKEKKISASATVQSAAPVSATESHAVTMLFVNQTTTIGDAPPTSSLSTVQVTLDRIDGRWLVSGFEPV